MMERARLSLPIFHPLDATMDGMEPSEFEGYLPFMMSWEIDEIMGEPPVGGHYR
jgi:hypothetical protein